MSIGLEKVFYQGSDGEYHKLGEIGEVNLATENVGKDFFSSDPIEFECSLELDKDFDRMVRSGFNRGWYNGLTLKEEGHLDSKNGWMHG